MFEIQTWLHPPDNAITSVHVVSIGIQEIAPALTMIRRFDDLGAQMLDGAVTGIGADALGDHIYVSAVAVQPRSLGAQIVASCMSAGNAVRREEIHVGTKHRQIR